jgi:sigma-B regulation protein RsbU (phosphoserine phosphatase)
MTTDTTLEFVADWPDRSQFTRSIRREFSLFVSLLVMALMAVTGWVITRQYAGTAQRQVVEKLLVQARSFSGPAGKHILSADGPDVLLLSDICRKLALDNPDVHWAGITAADGRFVAHTDMRRVIASERLAHVDATGQSEFARAKERVAVRNDTVYIVIPIEESGIEVGQLAVASSGREIAQARRRAVITVASITAVMILAGIPLIMLMLHRKLRPLSAITRSLQEVDLEKGTFDIPVRSRNEFGYLAETLRTVGSKLGAARRQAVERLRIAQELEIAHEVQHSILPRVYPRAEAFEFAGAYRSAREVGGDYYDFIDFDHRHLAFLVADVSGKSLPGMLVMLLTRDIIKRLARSVPEPASLLANLNRELMPNIRKGMFVTMFFGVLDKETGVFRFASAGHNPLVVVRDNGAHELHRPKGYPLGMMAPRAFEERLESGQVQLAPGDWLIQFTDGVNEAQNTAEEEFGMDRFTQLLVTHRALSPDKLVEETLRHVEGFVGAAPQFDDITLLAMKWKGQSTDQKGLNAKGVSRVGQNR